MLQIMKSGQQLDEKCRFMVSLLGEPPSDSAQAVTMQRTDSAVQHGRYESLIHSDTNMISRRRNLPPTPNSPAVATSQKLFDIRKFQGGRKSSAAAWFRNGIFGTIRVPLENGRGPLSRDFQRLLSSVEPLRDEGRLSAPARNDRQSHAIWNDDFYPVLLEL